MRKTGNPRPVLIFPCVVTASPLLVRAGHAGLAKIYSARRPFFANSAACSAVCRLSFGRDIHWRMTFRRCLVVFHVRGFPHDLLSSLSQARR